VPTSCLLASGANDPVIGGWTTASLRQGSLLSSAPKSGHQTSALTGGAWTQVSRLGMPLVNELVIGLPDKDKFNNSKPKDDGQFATYVTNPTLPRWSRSRWPRRASRPRTSRARTWWTTFLTASSASTSPRRSRPRRRRASLPRCCASTTAIPPTAEASQNRLGLLGGLLGPAPQDLAGYPNGRRPSDDVVDISLIAVMGGLCVANGNADTYKFGAACKPSAAPLAPPPSAFTTASTRPARRSRPTARCCRRSRTSARRCRVRSEEGAMKKTLLATFLAASMLGACGGGDDTPPPPPATSEVPASASQSPAGFIAYLQQLVASMADLLERSTRVPSCRPPTTSANRPRSTEARGGGRIRHP
jgi:hypothetical protein